MAHLSFRGPDRHSRLPRSGTFSIALAGLAFSGLLGCASAPPKPKAAPDVQEVWVKHHLVPCEGWAGQDYCYSVSDKMDGPWRVAYDGLQNFHFQWGFSYRLVVIPAGDDPKTSEGMRVLKVAKKVPAQLGTEFKFPVDPKLAARGLRNHLEIAEGVGQILNGPEFTCETESLCEDLEKRMASREPFVVTFTYGYTGVRATGVGETTTSTRAMGSRPSAP